MKAIVPLVLFVRKVVIGADLVGEVGDMAVLEVGRTATGF